MMTMTMTIGVVLCREVVLLFLFKLVVVVVLVGDQAVVLESYQLYSRSAPLCEEERHGGGGGEKEDKSKEEKDGRGRGGYKRQRREDEEEMEEERQRCSRGGVVGEKGQEGGAGLANVAFVYQRDSEATLVLLKVVVVLPSKTLGSVDEA